MGAIFFYIFIFFVGYYGSNLLNLLTVRPLVTNRYIVALLPVYGIACMHAYMIVTRPLPQGKGVTVESALLEFIAIPIVVVTVGAIYFMWNSKGNQDYHSEPSIKKSASEPAEIETTQTDNQPANSNQNNNTKHS